jgi:hypothetical protein
LPDRRPSGEWTEVTVILSTTVTTITRRKLVLLITFFSFPPLISQVKRNVVSEDPEHHRVTYNDVSHLISALAVKIQAEFSPDMFIAIGARALARSEMRK